MEFRRLRSCEEPGFDEVMALYGISFPIYEQRKETSQRAIMAHDDYHFLVIEEGGQWCGALLAWESEECIYVEHFCVRPHLRGQGIGRRALAKLRERGKTVILEIDPPIDDVSLRRKGFYERCGYRANLWPHVHPPYREGYHGHDLVVMSCPREIDAPAYEAFKAYLDHVVMGQ